MVTSIVKQLQHLVDEDVFATMHKVYKEEKAARSGRAPSDYKTRVVKNLKDNGHANEVGRAIAQPLSWAAGTASWLLDA